MPAFLEFAGSSATAVPARSLLREAITSATRRPEPECLPPLIAEARRAQTKPAAIDALARRLVAALRGRRASGGLVEGLLQEFSLSSTEGVALMCLAEALLRIPDRPTRDALIRDKISRGHWREHVGRSSSAFVNAAAWGLMITGRLVATNSDGTMSAALTRLIGKGGEPLIRKGVDMAMRVMGEQFVTGETIDEALSRSRRLEARGFKYSYDMLGEAAITAEDAARYHARYVTAIHAIGRESGGRGIYEGPGISIKLSALHPRYSRAQRDRVMSELVPRVRELALLARGYDIGLNIDAEEAERLEISLDVLEVLCVDRALARWNGLGFVVQAYQKRCPFVIDHLVDLAERSGRRLMVRLVKGAYWDGEIKRAQLDGLADYPVYTRKVHTDVAYLACARRLLDAPEGIYPQFATHNAYTVAAVHEMAAYEPGRYEFQCLHGMGEPLYDEVTRPVGEGGLGLPCRIYAPVGTHETLLAYLVRRLLENGANTSFVNLIADQTISIDALVADPVATAMRSVPLGRPHESIPLPGNLYMPRRNSTGIDLADEQRLAEVNLALQASVLRQWRAAPTCLAGWSDTRADVVLNPADLRDAVGHVIDTSSDELELSLVRAARSAAGWGETPVAERAACLERAAEALQTQMLPLLGLIMREAGKTVANAVGEIRESIDFLRYYALLARIGTESNSESAGTPLGVIACISPWNFPLSIFIGQVAAALVAGNTVLAKPAEQTPLIAAQAVDLLLECGIPDGVLQLVPGSGESIGAALVADSRVQGVVFTGSTGVARSIASTLAERLDKRGCPVVLIAETGGLNAMVVDSSALAEQVVVDAVQSAFDSAGQRCSALRVLCLQDEIADRTLAMLKGALRELSVGNPDRLCTDVGPVIDEEARAGIEKHIAGKLAAGCRVEREQVAASDDGYFVAPTIIEIGSLMELEREIFGPVLHVVRYPREHLGRLMSDLDASGYGLTFGLHTRIDETIAEVLGRVHAGNVYVNRNIVGAVVGVQPFGGEGLSGTGPKAGGPLYLHRLSSGGQQPTLAFDEAVEWQGPTGERNTWHVVPRGRVLCIAETAAGASLQWQAVASTRNIALCADTPASRRFASERSNNAADGPEFLSIGDASAFAAASFDAVLFEGNAEALVILNRQIARRPGPIIQVQSLTPQEAASSTHGYSLIPLIHERSVSVNTAAAGGNAALMTIG